MSVAHEQWDIVSSVGWTALMVAAGRAVETHRSDGLVRDPWAERFVAATGADPALPTRVDQRWPAPGSGQDAGRRADQDEDVQRYWDLLAAYQGVRSRYFDTALTRAAEQGVDQVVLLAAGLDTRAFRLDWPAGTTVFEVDQAGVLDFKDRVLDEQGARATCDRRRVDADLREDWQGALQRAGFDPDRRSAWLMEGLLPFLPAAAEADLFHAVNQLAAPGSSAAIEHFAPAVEAITAEHPGLLEQFAAAYGIDIVSLVSAEPRTEPTRRLGDLGWSVTPTRAADAASGYGRPLPTLSSGLQLDSVLISADR